MGVVSFRSAVEAVRGGGSSPRYSVWPELPEFFMLVVKPIADSGVAGAELTHWQS